MKTAWNSVSKKVLSRPRAANTGTELWVKGCRVCSSTVELLDPNEQLDDDNRGSFGETGGKAPNERNEENEEEEVVGETENADKDEVKDQDCAVDSIRDFVWIEYSRSIMPGESVSTAWQLIVSSESGSANQDANSVEISFAPMLGGQGKVSIRSVR